MKREALAIMKELHEWLLDKGQPPRYAIKNPFGVVDDAARSGNMELLRCYQKSIAVGCGVVGAHYMFPELTERGFEAPEAYIEKWRVDIRQRILGIMQNIPKVMNESGIPESAIDCMVAGYAAADEETATRIAALIEERKITNLQDLREVLALQDNHANAVSLGAL